MRALICAWITRRTPSGTCFRFGPDRCISEPWSKAKANCFRSMEKNISRGKSMDDIKLTVEIEATDQLGMLVRRIQLEAPGRGDLRQQAVALVEKIDYL